MKIQQLVEESILQLAKKIEQWLFLLKKKKPLVIASELFAFCFCIGPGMVMKGTVPVKIMIIER